MRILFVNQNCGYLGGVEQYIADNGRGLAERGHEVFLAYGSLTDKNSDEFKSFFSGCYCCSELGEGPGAESLPIKSINDRVRPDLIFAHKLAKIDFLLKILPEVPVVRMIHDHDLCCPRRHKYYFWNGRICNHKVDWRCFLDLAFLEKRSEGLFRLGYFDIFEHFQQLKKNRLLPCLAVGSRWMQKELLQNGFSERQVKIHPPVVRMPEPEYKAPGNARSFLYVGQGEKIGRRRLPAGRNIASHCLALAIL